MAARYLNTGGRYNPTEQLDGGDHHRRARRARGHTAVWTGSEMIVWGGSSGTYLNDTYSYTPERTLYLYQRP